MVELDMLVIRNDTAWLELYKAGECSSTSLDFFLSVCCENPPSHGNLNLSLKLSLEPC